MRGARSENGADGIDDCIRSGPATGLDNPDTKPERAGGCCYPSEGEPIMPDGGGGGMAQDRGRTGSHISLDADPISSAPVELRLGLLVKIQVGV